MTRDEYITLRIWELTARREEAAKFVMNKDLPIERALLDAQIDSLQKLLTPRPAGGEAAMISQSPTGDIILHCECDHCDFKAQIMCDPDAYPEYCPGCGKDGYGVGKDHAG